MTEQQIQDEIKSQQATIESLKEALPYADGQVYYKDQRRIRESETRIRTLEYQLKVARGEITPTPRSNVKQQKEIVNEHNEHEKKELQRFIDEETRKRCDKHVNRFKNKRTRTSARTQRFYLKKVDYNTGKVLKTHYEELRWDPYVKRWYASVFIFGGQKYSPGVDLQEHMLDDNKNYTAQDWSAKIKHEIETLPPMKRELTIRVHGHGNPKV